ncbi:MAG: hypothetical protein J6Z49_09050 [Kiritimatiellae bacterium]|nr:hypothetical protein [Kiritimatiellia bacterium]
METKHMRFFGLFGVFSGTGIDLPCSKSSLPTHTNESKQTDLLTLNGVCDEEVSRVNGEQIRVPEGNRDCRFVNNED